MGKAADNPHGKRRPGRPASREKVIGPIQLEKIKQDFLRRRPVLWTAQELGVHHSTVQQHLETKILPDLHRRSVETENQELARIEHLEREAWAGFDRSREPAIKERIEKEAPPVDAETAEKSEAVLSKASEKTLRDHGVKVKKVRERIYRDGETAWLDLVKWCIAERNRMMGRYAADKGDAPAGDGVPQVNFVVMEERKDVLKFERFKQYERRVSGNGSTADDN